MHRFAATLLAAALLLPAAAIGQTAPADAPPTDGPPVRTGNWQVNLGAGALTAPAYPGARRQKPMLLPSVDASYGDVVFAGFPDLVKVDAVRLVAGPEVRLHAGPLVTFRFGRASHGDGVPHGLHSVGDTAAVGGYVSYDVTEAIAVKAEATQAVRSGYGLQAETGLSYTHRFGPLLTILNPFVRLDSAEAMQRNFGITPGEAAASGLAAFKPKGGIEGAGLAAVLIFPLTQRVSLTGTATFERLTGQAARSPIVHHGGSASQFSGGLFLTYALF